MKLIQKDPTGNGHHTPIDSALENPGEYAPSDLQKLTAQRTQQFFSAIQKDALANRTPGDAPKVAAWPEDGGGQ